MARWITLGLTILGFGMVFTTRNAGVLGIGLLFAIFGFLGFVYVLAADRVASSARSDASMATVEDLQSMRKRVVPTPRATAEPLTQKDLAQDSNEVGRGS